MTVQMAIKKRRSYRMLEPVEISDRVIEELAKAARLSPSCYNNQPWRFIFIREKNILNQMFAALSRGNAWAKSCSLIIAVFGKKQDDCIIKEREYCIFDLGIATASIMLRATELQLVAHPIAGFSPEKVKTILGIPRNNMVITLLIVGKKTGSEEERPARRKLSQIFSLNSYNKELEQ